VQKDKKKILKVIGVSKKYKKQFALINISFDLYEGEVFGLVGPNGAGKTTLLRIIAGLIRNFSGDVSCSIKSKNKFGCIIESAKIYPYLSGYNSLKYASLISGNINKKELNSLIGLSNLSSAIKKKVKTYSFGMKQRLVLIEAMLGEPKILILDEPTNGLDPKGVNDMRNYLRKMIDKNKSSAIISSHSLNEVEKICDRVMILKKGNLIKIIDMHNKIASEDKIFAFEFADHVELENFLNFLNHKNIIIKDFNDSVVKIFLAKEKLFNFIKELVLKEIVFTSVYEVHETLEEKFLNLTGEDKDV
jgi:ABC-2 type transport system ATP-binding protein